MSKRGFPGGMGGFGGMNIGNLMKEAKKMQADMEKTQTQLTQMEFTATAGGGAVTAVVTGAKVIKSLKIKPEVVDPDDVETEIMDKVNVLGNKFAEENQDVIEGLKRSAAAMSAMGQSFTDTAALFTGGMEILQDSESMGTALRALSMRVRGYDEETNQLSDDLVNVTGEVADLTKTAQDSQGVSLFTDATQEHYRSMVEYLGDIADRWDQISEKNQTELLQKLFGKNRANAGAAIIQNFDQVRAAIEAMDKSAGSSEAEMSAIESSLSYKINALKETWVGCVQDMVDRGDLGTIVTGLTKVSEAITFLLDKLGILGSIGLGAGIFSGIKNVGIGTLVAHQSNHCYCFDVPTS